MLKCQCVEISFIVKDDIAPKNVDTRDPWVVHIFFSKQYEHILLFPPPPQNNFNSNKGLKEKKVSEKAPSMGDIMNRTQRREGQTVKAKGGFKTKK